MFGKTERKTDQGRPAAPSIFSASLIVEGSAISDGDIEIAGKLKGNVVCRKLILGPDGIIAGEVKAEIAILHGTVEGQVEAVTVEIASTARIRGDVIHNSIAIEAGAHIEGKLNRKANGDIAVLTDQSGQPLVLTKSLETA